MSQKNKKIHVTHIIPALPFGGAERFLVDLVNNSSERFLHSIIIFRDEQPIAVEFAREVSIRIVPKRGKISLGLIKDLALAIKQEKPDIVHSHLFGGDVWGRMAASMAGIPAVATEHNTNLGESFWRHAIKRRLARLSLAYAAPSAAVALFMEKTYKIKKDLITIIPYGIDLARFLNVPPLIAPPFRLLILGRFTRQKGHDIAFKALAQIPDFPWRLSCVGRGEEEKKLRKLACSLGLEKKITFRQPIADVASLFRDHQILLLPSRWEGLGIVGMEAMAAGRPVIGSLVGGIPEVVKDSEHGILVPPENVGALVEALRGVFEEPEILLIMGKKAKEYAKENFGADKMTAAYEKWYELASMSFRAERNEVPTKSGRIRFVNKWLSIRKGFLGSVPMRIGTPLGMTSNAMPTDCVLGITYACNSKCVMCDIWQIANPPQIDPNEYRKLPPTLRDINISGGEPFLHPEIVKIVKVLTETCPKARLVISTNGFASALIEQKMKEILRIKPDIGIAISIDGIGKMHEQVRGVLNAYEKAINTLECLQKLGMKNLRFAFTVLPQNVEHFSLVYNEARERGVQFTHALAQSSEHYFGGKQINTNPDQNKLKQEYEYVIKQELKSWKPKNWARAYFTYGLFQFAVKKEQLLANDAGSQFFYLDPSGIVFPSVVHNYPMGDIKEIVNWSDLWFSKQADEVREKVRKENRPVWMICTARTAIRRHPFRVGWWVLKNKLK